MVRAEISWTRGPRVIVDAEEPIEQIGFHHGLPIRALAREAQDLGAGLDGVIVRLIIAISLPTRARVRDIVAIAILMPISMEFDNAPIGTSSARAVATIGVRARIAVLHDMQDRA